MLQNNNKYEVLKVFLKSPTREFGLREVSRKVGVALPSIKKYLLELEKEGIVEIREVRGYPVYVANIDSEKFRNYQNLSTQYELIESGVIDYIWKKLCPEAIIFYGSHSKGEAMDDSDIDLFVIGSKSGIKLSKYEKLVGREIHLMSDKLENIPKELKNNLINGIVMKGYLKVLK